MPFAPPRSLSPSKVSAFTECPLAFRLSVIDRLPEPPSPAAVKGTLVHSVLEGLMWNHPPGRRTRAAAADELDSAWRALHTDPEFLQLALPEAQAEAFRADAASLVDNYFELEDPDSVDAVGVELGMEVQIGPMRLRGIIDRLDRNAEGDLVVIDYKTGRAPSARFEHSRLGGVHIYALLCRELLGRAPVEVRLLYLRDPVAIAAAPSDQTVRGQAGRTTAVWSAIERACSREDFRPRRSPLCRFCHFQDMCPEFGGQPPPGPQV
ncbi:MAG: RecB family exonuclease [Acidimicrobiales bacterium]